MSTASSLPPLGDPTKAENYINRLIRLIDKDKAPVFRTNLDKFDLTSIQNHYRVDLGDYDVEVSHSIQPETDKDFYTMIFNSIKKVTAGSSNKIILAYIHLDEDQFKRFKVSADEALERQQRRDDTERFTEVMTPVDSLFDNLDPDGPSSAQYQAPESLDNDTVNPFNQ